MTGDRMIDVVAPAATPRNAKCACGSGSRSLYGSILHAVPGLPDAEHMIGVVGLCEGDYVRALSTLRRVAGRRAAWASRPVIHESTTSGPWPWTPLTRESIEALEAAEREAVGRAASPATIGAMRRRWKIGIDLAFVRGYHAARARLGGAARGD